VTLLTAKQKTTASFDLHKTSMDYVVAIGQTAAHVLNLSPSDNTHLNDNGALVFGRYALLYSSICQAHNYFLVAG
jgi:hypothetical protein